MKKIIFSILIAFAIVGNISAQRAISMQRFENQSYCIGSEPVACADSMCYRGMDFKTSILWPIDGLPSKERYTMRQYIATMVAGESIAKELANRLNLTRFPEIMHKRIMKDISQDPPKYYGENVHQVTELPSNVALDKLHVSMELKRAYGGVYTFLCYLDLYSVNKNRSERDMSTLNYNVDLGRPLKLDDVLVPERIAEISYTIKQMVTEQLKANADLSEEYIESLNYDVNLNNADNWYLGDEGLVYNYLYLGPESDVWQYVQVMIPIRDYLHLFRAEARKYWKY